MIRTRVEACRILGLGANATKDEVKNAYKTLVKKYHPDSTGVSDANAYQLVVEAYEFLNKDIVVSGNKIMDGRQTCMTATRGVLGGSSFRTTASSSDYAAFQKKIKKQKQQKAIDFEQKEKDYSEKIKKQDEDYKRAMEAIDAIRTARAIEAMVRANGFRKDNNDKSNEE